MPRARSRWLLAWLRACASVGGAAGICGTAFIVGAAGCSNEEPSPAAVGATYHATAVAPLGCVPNLDGTIDAAHLPTVLNTPEYYLQSKAGQTVSVNLDGVVNAARQQVWDQSQNAPGDQLRSLTGSPLAGKWYASSFPAAEFVIPSDLADTLEGVYSADSAAVWLYGFASTQQTPASGTTLLVYAQPIAAYQFPLSVGVTWSATGTVASGTLDGIPWTEVDTYQFSVDKQGILELPDFNLTQVLRLRTVVTATNPGAGSLVTRTTQLLSQCLGQTYLATSQPNEPSDDFTTAAEVRRLSLQE